MRQLPEDPAEIIMMLFLGAFFGLTRWVVYVNRYSAPISLKGRFCTGRWIIWRHDGPLASAAMLPFIAVATQLALTRMNLRVMDSVPVASNAVNQIRHGLL
jgi:hypothetical protein